MDGPTPTDPNPQSATFDTKHAFKAVTIKPSNQKDRDTLVIKNRLRKDNGVEEKTEMLVPKVKSIPKDIKSKVDRMFGLPMFNWDIENILRNVKGFIGVFNINQIEDISPPVTSKRFGFIFNTAKLGSPGEHWIGVVIDPVIDKSVMFYDSFGRPPNSLFLKQLQRLISKLKNPHYLKMKYNLVQEQDNSSTNCGWFCLRFIINIMVMNKPFKVASGFKKDTHVKGEKDIKNLQNKFKKFLYIK